MRIAFVGKGGSGKTTTSALFSRIIAAKKLSVLAVDADINQHLAVALGEDEEVARDIPAMGYHLDMLKEYLRGNNVNIEAMADFLKTTPPANGSRLLKITEQNDIFTKLSHGINGVCVMVSGPYDEQDIGLRCYHGKQGSVEILLNHLVDRPQEYVVVDLTAGADSFASGLFLKFDITFLVVEPTIKGLGVYRQYKNYAREHDITIKVIANKVEDEDDVRFVQDAVGNDFFAAMTRSAYVRSMERGDHRSLNELEPENAEVLERMFALVNNTPQNWQRMYQNTARIHHKKAMNEPDAKKRKRLLAQIDPDFTYPVE